MDLRFCRVQVKGFYYRYGYRGKYGTGQMNAVGFHLQVNL